MAEKIAFENRRISNFERLVTLTLDRVIPSCITHWPLPTWQILLKSKKLCGRVDRHLRPNLLGRLRRVNLIITITEDLKWERNSANHGSVNNMVALVSKTVKLWLLLTVKCQSRFHLITWPTSDNTNDPYAGDSQSKLFNISMSAAVFRSEAWNSSVLIWSSSPVSLCTLQWIQTPTNTYTVILTIFCRYYYCYYKICIAHKFKHARVGGAGGNTVLHGGSALWHWTCDWQVKVQFPSSPLSCNIGQLSLTSLWGH